MYLVGQISEKANANSTPKPYGLLELWEQNNRTDAVIKDTFNKQYGVPVNDIAILDTDTLSQSDRDRLAGDDDYIIEWTGDNITGVDFTIEDDKYVFDFEVDGVTPDSNGWSEEITNANGIGTVTIKCNAFKKDGVTPLVLTGNREVPVTSPLLGTVLHRVAFTDGVGEIVFKTEVAGDWYFPQPTMKRFSLGSGNIVRVRNRAKVVTRIVF